MRNSPTESATLYKVGFKKVGNCGCVYEIVKTANGVKRWRKLQNKEEEKYKEIKNKYKKLKISDIKKLSKNDKIKLGVFHFGDGKFIKFIFTLDRIETPTLATQKKYIKYNIHGKSEYTGSLPIWVTNFSGNKHTKGDIKFAMSSDESPIFIV